MTVSTAMRLPGWCLVIAFTAAAVSGSSVLGETSSSTFDPPGAPQNVTWERVMEGGRNPETHILVSWAPPDSFAEGDADGWGFTVYYTVVDGEGISDEQHETLEAGDLRFELPWHPEAMDSYIVEVAAFNPAGEGPRSETKVITPGTWPSCDPYSYGLDPPGVRLQAGCLIQDSDP